MPNSYFKIRLFATRNVACNFLNPIGYLPLGLFLNTNLGRPVVVSFFFHSGKHCCLAKYIVWRTLVGVWLTFLEHIADRGVEWSNGAIIEQSSTPWKSDACSWIFTHAERSVFSVFRVVLVCVVVCVWCVCCVMCDVCCVLCDVWCVVVWCVLCGVGGVCPWQTFYFKIEILGPFFPLNISQNF